MTASFRAHGEFKTRVDGRILISEVRGPWNKELIEIWAADMYPYAKELNLTGPHVGIAIVSGSLLCPPDALEALRRAIHYGASRLNSIGNIIVAAADVEGRSLMMPTFARMYDGATPHRYFYEFAPAREWALELLAAKGF
jgi:hypothetical protein